MSEFVAKDPVERVVLLDEQGEAVGTLPKDRVHHAATPLHLAFSCYVFNSSGEFLLTRRAWSKRTWPGVWTNSCCGHPGPGERVQEAVTRRLKNELGLETATPTLLLADFRYRAVMANGIAENEYCPVFGALTDHEPEPKSDEVVQSSWIGWPDFLARVADESLQVSPWCRLQLRRLAGLGADPLRWPEADASALPPAARRP